MLETSEGMEKCSLSGRNECEGVGMVAGLKVAGKRERL